MYGGPFYSAGFVRIVNGVHYNCRYVSFARWVSLMIGGKSLDYVEVRRNRRKIWSGPEAGLSEFLECNSSGQPNVSETAQAQGES